MADLSEVLRSTIANYPTCPVAHLVAELSRDSHDTMNEKEVIELLSSIKRHEEELRVFRKLLEKELLNYQVESILGEPE